MKSESNFSFDEKIELFNTFGRDFDRFDFPCSIKRATAGHGGECFLIEGSRANAIYDCGMAYCGSKSAENLAEMTDHIEYIILSHSHYDHIGALPYIVEKFPDAEICASEKCSRIIGRESAKAIMYDLGMKAKELYTPESEEDIPFDFPDVTRVLHDGDVIDLGDVKITAYETKGHTDCSMSFYLEPAGLLFTSESTGILEGKDYVHTPVLKSFQDAAKSLEKCRALNPEYVCLPHFGMLPADFNDKFFRMFEEECESKKQFVREMMSEGLKRDEMLEKYVVRYWTPAKEKEQPYEAFCMNSGHILDALINDREINDTEKEK